MKNSRKVTLRVVLGMEAERALRAQVRRQAAAELLLDVPQIARSLNLFNAQTVVTTRALDKACRNSTQIIRARGLIQNAGPGKWELMPFG